MFENIVVKQLRGLTFPCISQHTQTMENAEEILQCLDEFSKLKPKDIPRELEDYLGFVARTGDPVYQWPLIKCLFREKLIAVITEFYETCPSVEIPPCPNVDAFNYDAMKVFILDKLDTFAAAPFTVQRICELLTAPRKEYNRIDKYMRALEKNILVVSTREPGNRKSTENGESIVNGLESEHISEINSDINVEVEMDETASVWAKTDPTVIILDTQSAPVPDTVQDAYVSESKTEPAPCGSNIPVITTRPMNYIGYTPNITDLIIEPSITTTVEPSETPADSSINVFAMTTEPIIPTEPPEVAKEDSEAAPAFAETEVQIEPLVQNGDGETSKNVIINTETENTEESIVPSVVETFQQIPVVQAMVQPIPTVVQSLVEPIQPITEPVEAVIQVAETVVAMVEPDIETVETMVEPESEIETVPTIEEIVTVELETKIVETLEEEKEEVVEKTVEPIKEIIEPIQELVELVVPVQEVVETVVEMVQEMTEIVKTVEPVQELVQPIQAVESSIPVVESLVEPELLAHEVMQDVEDEVETSEAQIETSILNTSEAVTEMTITSTDDDLKSATDDLKSATDVQKASEPEPPTIETAIVESTVPDEVDSLPVLEPKPALEPADEGMEVDETPEEIITTSSLADVKEDPTGDITEAIEEKN